MEKAEDLPFFSPYADRNLWTEAGYTSGIRSHCEHRICCEEPICCLTVCLISQTGNRSSGNINIYSALIKVGRSCYNVKHVRIMSWQQRPQGSLGRDIDRGTGFTTTPECFPQRGWSSSCSCFASVFVIRLRHQHLLCTVLFRSYSACCYQGIEGEHCC